MGKRGGFTSPSDTGVGGRPDVCMFFLTRTNGGFNVQTDRSVYLTFTPVMSPHLYSFLSGTRKPHCRQRRENRDSLTGNTTIPTLRLDNKTDVFG